MIVGGAETLLRDAITGINLKYPSIEQHLITLYGDGKQLDSIKDIVKYKNLAVSKINFLLKSIELKKYIKENDINVVHAHLYDAMILARFAIPIRVPLFYTYHNGIHNLNSTDYSLIRKLIDRLTYNKRQYAIFVSKAVETDILMGIKIPGPSKVLPNFTSPSFCYSYDINNNNNNLKLVSVGNLRKQKNHEFSIKVMTLLKDYPVSLDIYGGGLLQKELEKLISDSGANVKLIINCIVNCETLSKYDAFFMSSTQEGMSIAVLEAMAVGLPSILSNIDSFLETAENSALYFDLENLENSKEQILKIIDNKLLLNKLSQNAEKLSNKYSLDTYLTTLYNLFSSSLS